MSPSKDVYTLYQPDLEAVAQGVPFVTSRGLTVWLLPEWAEEWDRFTVDRAVMCKDYLELEWYDMPADLRERISIREFGTAVVRWDLAQPDGSALPCTSEAKRQVATEVRPFRLEVLAEVRDRRAKRLTGLAALGKDSGSPSEPNSSTPAARTGAPSTAT